MSALLDTDVKSLGDFGDGCYSLWKTKIKRSHFLAGIDHKSRKIQNPKPDLKLLQKKITILLSKIERPIYLYSAAKGKNHVKNALAHKDSENLLKIDIKSFYQSATRKYIRRFFLDECKCSDDVAYILTNLCSYDGHLPTGAACSPILSFFAYKEMFDELFQLANKNSLVMTLYVDDIAISGQYIPDDYLEKCLNIIEKYQLIGHKISKFKCEDTKVITGVAFNKDAVFLPHKRMYRIRKLRLAFKLASTFKDKEVLAKALIGQYREGAHIVPSLKYKANLIIAELNSVSGA